VCTGQPGTLPDQYGNGRKALMLCLAMNADINRKSSLIEKIPYADLSRISSYPNDMPIGKGGYLDFFMDDGGKFAFYR
jgi:Asp-tRNA(Asn)/Glu-tRNA(Gln) amidotransferase B subunit